MHNIVIEIKEDNGKIYRITQKGKYRFLCEGPEGSGYSGKSFIGFNYQILTNMVKMEPERFEIIQDHGMEILGIGHMPVESQDWILFLGRVDHFEREWDIERCEREILQTQKTVEYDTMHGLKTNFTTGTFQKYYPEEMVEA